MLESFVIFATLTGWALKIYFLMHVAAFLLSWINADPNNAFVSIINRSTRPLWDWAEQRLPRQITPLAPFVALMLVSMAVIVVPGIITSQGAILGGNVETQAGLKNMVMYLLYGGLSILSDVVFFILFLAILWFVFTLVNPPLNNPIIRTVWFIIDPLISPLQRILPRASIDLSPLVLAFIAYFLRYQILARLMEPVVDSLMKFNEPLGLVLSQF